MGHLDATALSPNPAEAATTENAVVPASAAAAATNSLPSAVEHGEVPTDEEENVTTAEAVAEAVPQTAHRCAGYCVPG